MKSWRFQFALLLTAVLAIVGAAMILNYNVDTSFAFRKSYVLDEAAKIVAVGLAKQVLASR
jgi:hypothetical protein